MAEKKPGNTPEEQSNRFVEDAQKLIDAGELNPTEAAERLNRLVPNLLRQKPLQTGQPD